MYKGRPPFLERQHVVHIHANEMQCELSVTGLSKSCRQKTHTKGAGRHLNHKQWTQCILLFLEVHSFSFEPWSGSSDIHYFIIFCALGVQPGHSVATWWCNGHPQVFKCEFRRTRRNESGCNGGPPGRGPLASRAGSRSR